MTEGIVKKSDGSYERFENISDFTEKREFANLGGQIMIFSKLPKEVEDAFGGIPKEINVTGKKPKK